MILERMGQPLSYCELEDCTLILQARLSAAEAKVAEFERKVALPSRWGATYDSLKDEGCLDYTHVPMVLRILEDFGAAEAKVAEQAATIERLTGYKTAFDTAREQILHMVGPLEINEILTTMDEACEQAAPSKQEPK